MSYRSLISNLEEIQSYTQEDLEEYFTDAAVAAQEAQSLLRRFEAAFEKMEEAAMSEDESDEEEG